MSYTGAVNYYDEADVEDVSLMDLSFVDVGLEASLIYDTRGNTIMPADGYLLELIRWNYGGTIGGDFDYDTTRLLALRK